MNVVHKECDCVTLAFVGFLALFLTLFHEFIVKLDEQQYLIPNIGEKVILPNQVEHVGPPESQEKR